jgi:hypothetical protein
MDTNPPPADQKEVSLTLSSAAEAKALSRGTTRRRRSRKEVEEDGMLGMTGGANLQVERMIPTETVSSAASAPVPVSAPVVPTYSPVPAPVVPTYAPVPPPVPAAPLIPVVTTPATPSTPIAPLAGTTAVGGGGVRIQAKRMALSPPVPASAAAPQPKIMPHKKRPQSAPASAQTFKKPRFLVTPTPAQISDDPGAEVKKTRKFAERKISITVKPAAQTRRMRRTLKHRIHTMPIGAVHKYLLRKGVLKPKANAPPEEIMRSMMRDYLLLHTPE